MSAIEAINSMRDLTEAQRQRALQVQAEIERLEDELQAILGRNAPSKAPVDLRARGIDQNQAADLRGRLKTFAEDWDRPEADIYDEDPAR